jgi:hypothetical protein
MKMSSRQRQGADTGIKEIRSRISSKSAVIPWHLQVLSSRNPLRIPKSAAVQIPYKK